MLVCVNSANLGRINLQIYIEIASQIRRVLSRSLHEFSMSPACSALVLISDTSFDP